MNTQVYPQTNYINLNFTKKFRPVKSPSVKKNTTKRELTFSKVTSESMEEIWPFLQREHGRTTDFSYGGILMWVSYFNYEYCILDNTLFIKGKEEGDLSKGAFALPIGDMKLEESITLLKEYCKKTGEQLILSAVPEYSLEELEKLSPALIEEIPDWGDYVYDAHSLAYLKGKKYNKKRNHVNKFISCYQNWSLVPLTSKNSDIAMELMDRYDPEGDSTEMAIVERELSRKMIKAIKDGDSRLIGAILMADSEPCAFTIGDIKGDTLFIHIEKALREYPGSFEMINSSFAKNILESIPEIKFINREDDSGDEGLRKAKESYHPVFKINKYNILF